MVERKKSWQSFAKGRPIRMIIKIRPAHLDDHLQKAEPLGSSFAKCRLIRMIICKRPAHPDDHLQKATTATLPTTTSCVYHFSLSWISYNNIFLLTSLVKILKGRRFVDVDVFTKQRCFFREKIISPFSGAFIIKSHFAKDFEKRETIIIIFSFRTFLWL